MSEKHRHFAVVREKHTKEYSFDLEQMSKEQLIEILEEVIAGASLEVFTLTTIVKPIQQSRNSQPKGIGK